MTDWTTCRVVRDCDGDLWFRGCDSDDLWTANTNYPDVFLTTDEVLTVFGPLAPVLDAYGLPVVHTVGDLTARHETPDVAELRRLLAGAWDEGGDFVTRHPGMSAEYVRAANPYRQTEGNRA